MVESKYLHILPDICKLDIEEFEDSALGSLDNLDSITNENISYDPDEKLSYRSNGNSEYEVELLNEMNYLKIELEGERAAKLKYEKNYLEIKESCIQLNKKLIKESEEIDHNMELINDLSQAASEVHEENIRCKVEVNYWRQQCGWLSQKLNQIQISKPEVEVRYVQTENKPKWLQEFHDIEDDLNEDEKEYVRNTIE